MNIVNYLKVPQIVLLFVVCLFGIRSYAVGFEFTLTGYTDNSSMAARFDCEGGGLHPSIYKNSNIEYIGTVNKSSCTVSLGGAINRAFHAQALDSKGSEKADIRFLVNTYDKQITGPAFLDQKSIFLDNGYVFSFGVSSAPEPLGSTAYAYVGQSNTRWMGDLIKDSRYNSVTLKELVLPGAHDSGTYILAVTNYNAAEKALCNSIYKDGPGEDATLGPVLAETLEGIKDLFCSASPELLKTLFINTGLTQKDDVTAMLRLGTRFLIFDRGSM